MKDLVEKAGLTDRFEIASAATSTEEIGNPVHYGTRRKLAELGISVEGKYARQLTKQDYDGYDYIIGMDSRNMYNISRILKCSQHDDKLHLLLEYNGEKRDIADPWYTGNFDETYEDVLAGCMALLEHIKSEKGI